MRLQDSFFHQNAVDVAQALLGKQLVFHGISGYITETEAYRGHDDLASHAAKGLTPRTAIMFGPPGYVYVYMIYGMYFCLNFVCEQEGQPAAVLIRGMQLPEQHIDGPGKLCRHLGINKSHNGICLLTDPSFYVTEGVSLKDVKSTSRIGIRLAQDKLWRFVGRVG